MMLLHINYESIRSRSSKGCLHKHKQEERRGVSCQLFHVCSCMQYCSLKKYWESGVGQQVCKVSVSIMQELLLMSVSFVAQEVIAHDRYILTLRNGLLTVLPPDMLTLSDSRSALVYTLGSTSTYDVLVLCD